MKIVRKFSLEVGTFAVNCTVLAMDNGQVWIVDPGSEADAILDLCEREGLVPSAILLTHAHFDHIGAIPGLLARYPELPVHVGEGDRAVITHPMNQMPPHYPPIAAPKNLRDARMLEGVRIIETPGHTPGGVCYLFPEDGLLLSGDTLFAGSVGRTDLPGGDVATLMASLEKLKELPDGTVVVPGHGPTTTIGREKAGNPFLQ